MASSFTLMIAYQSEASSIQLAQTTSLSLVVPCFNEQDCLDQLAERLKTLRLAFSEYLDLRVILVDDGSNDETADGLEQRFEHLEWASVLRHSHNRGLSAAILTGIQAATTDLVASMDADCTYDPIQLIDLWKAMDVDTAIVTASPYHPQGYVEGIPVWRLLLSKSASISYGCLMSTPLYTYTSCFRIYRRGWIENIQLRNQGFVGITEMLWDVARRGGKVIEAPAKLTSRRAGYSKMKTLPVILEHLKFMARIALIRCKLLRS